MIETNHTDPPNVVNDGISQGHTTGTDAGPTAEIDPTYELEEIWLRPHDPALLGSCPDCGAGIEDRHLQLEYERDAPALQMYVVCPLCNVVLKLC